MSGYKMELTLIEVLVAIVFTILVFGAGFNSCARVIYPEVKRQILQELEQRRIIEIVNDEIYSGWLHRFHDENAVAVELYDFFRQEIIRGNLHAFSLYNNLLRDKDRHVKFQNKIGFKDDATL